MLLVWKTALAGSAVRAELAQRAGHRAAALDHEGFRHAEALLPANVHQLATVCNRLFPHDQESTGRTRDIVRPRPQLANEYDLDHTFGRPG